MHTGSVPAAAYCNQQLPVVAAQQQQTVQLRLCFAKVSLLRAGGPIELILHTWLYFYGTGCSETPKMMIRSVKPFVRLTNAFSMQQELAKIAILTVFAILQTKHVCQ